MYPIIDVGDEIIVSKLTPGPRFYRNIKNIAPNGKVETLRFKGIGQIKRNDVVVFNSPYYDRETFRMNVGINYVKRCVAVPGDTFCIENGFYKVKNAIPEQVGYLPYQEKLSHEPDAAFEFAAACLFPDDTINYRWTMKNFGPLYLPRKGDCVAMDTINYIQYKKIIEYETDKSVSIHYGAVFLGDSAISRYTFRMNCYFMAGDYLFDSVDSRYWGLLPEDHIIGKAIFIWHSTDKETGKTRWKRIFKRINTHS